MTFKFENQELIALIKLISNTCEVHKKLLDDINGVQQQFFFKLQLSILQELHIKLQMKLFINKPSYKIKLMPYQEISLWLHFNGKLPRQDHAGNMVQIMCDRIHAHYSNPVFFM
jgi:hypothetical protein